MRAMRGVGSEAARGMFPRGVLLFTLLFSLRASSCAMYNIQVLHPNAQPLAPGDELTFINSMHQSDDGLPSARCPVGIVAFVSRGSPGGAAARIALQLGGHGPAIPMFPVMMTPHLRHVITAGTPFALLAGAADALQCSDANDAFSLTFRARALLLGEHNSTGQVLAESLPFSLRIICGTATLLSRACPGSAAPAPASACTLHDTAPWSPPYTSVGTQTTRHAHHLFLILSFAWQC